MIRLMREGIALVGCVLWAASVVAGPAERTTQGAGRTQKEAIWTALIEAVNQVQGVALDAQQESAFSFREFSNEDASFETHVSKNVSERTKGLISSYEILSLELGEKNIWLANVRVQLPEFKSVGMDRSHLRSIAILPFRSDRSGGATVASVENTLARKIAAQITQSRRFRVLDREFDTETNAELSRLGAGSVDVAELVRLGRKRAADYILVGTIAASGGIDFKVIEVALQEVRWADTVPFALPSESQDQNTGFSEGAVSVAAEEIAGLVLDAIYPIKVLAQKQAGDIYLNQGGSRARVGQVFNLYQNADSIHDPDSGLPIRVEGPLLGRIQIVDSRPKYAVARWVPEGVVSDTDLEGCICRRVAREEILADFQRAVSAEIERQEQLKRAGQLPAVEVTTFRTGIGWNFVLQNTGAKALNLNRIKKVMFGGSDDSALSLTLVPGGREAFSLNDRFAAGDRVEFYFREHESAYTHFFR